MTRRFTVSCEVDRGDGSATNSCQTSKEHNAVPAAVFAFDAPSRGNAVAVIEFQIVMSD
jgi:hypothetical protein